MKRIAVLFAVALVSLLAAAAAAGRPSSVPNDLVIEDRPSPSTTIVAVTSTATPTTPPPPGTSSTVSATSSPVSTDAPLSTDPTPDSESTPTTPSSVSSTTTTSTIVSTTPVEPAGLRVVVVNGTNQPRLGADNAGLLNALGYALAFPADAVDKDTLTTDVLFADGFREEAETLAGAMQIDLASVAPVPDEPLTVQDVDGDLWLMLGADRVP